MPPADSGKPSRAGRNGSGHSSSAPSRRRRGEASGAAPEAGSGSQRSNRLSSTRAATAAATSRNSPEQPPYQFTFSELPAESVYKYLMLHDPDSGSPLTYETAMFPDSANLESERRRNNTDKRGSNKRARHNKPRSDGASFLNAQQTERSTAAGGASTTTNPQFQEREIWSFDDKLLSYEDARGPLGTLRSRADTIWANAPPPKEQDILTHFLYACRMRNKHLKLDLP